MSPMHACSSFLHSYKEKKKAASTPCITTSINICVPCQIAWRTAELEPYNLVLHIDTSEQMVGQLTKHGSNH